MRDDNNKIELFSFLPDKICEVEMSSTVIVTKGENAISIKSKSLEGVAPCSHEEADSRIFVHARDETLQSSESIVIEANDTVVIIAVATLPSLQGLGLQTMWIPFGQGASARWIPVHDIVSAIGSEKTSGILYFLAFHTGCDVVSSFHGKANKSAWQTWDVCGDVSATFKKLSNCPAEVSDDDLQKLEEFVVIMSNRSRPVTGVDQARLDLFARKQRPYDAIPPTSAALKEHAKRAAYQAGVIWGQATIRNPEFISPANWGWTQKGKMLQVCSTTLPPIAASCQELTKCSCKKGCSRRCKCSRSGLSWTGLCSCVCEH